jgi:hypothetical protein
MHQALSGWRGRQVFVRERGVGYTDAYLATIDEHLLYYEDPEAVEPEPERFLSDWVLLMYLRRETGPQKVFGYGHQLGSAEITESVITFAFSDGPTYTIAVIAA